MLIPATIFVFTFMGWSGKYRSYRPAVKFTTIITCVPLFSYPVAVVFNTLLMCFCWYYLSSFCYCYPNTQINWLIGGFITWLFCLILPFIYCFLITLLRFLGLRYKMELMYKLSSCLSD
jgi:hypothetical protein